jgi:hypothetical protein
VILAVWSFNVLGVKPSLAVGYVTGALLMVPLFNLHRDPYITGTGPARTSSTSTMPATRPSASATSRSR